MQPGNVPIKEVTKALSGSDFPASKEQILKTAQRNQAPNQVLDLLRQIPDQRYESITDVTQQVGRLE